MKVAWVAILVLSTQVGTGFPIEQHHNVVDAHDFAAVVLPPRRALAIFGNFFGGASGSASASKSGSTSGSGSTPTFSFGFGRSNTGGGSGGGSTGGAGGGAGGGGFFSSLVGGLFGSGARSNGNEAPPPAQVTVSAAAQQPVQTPPVRLPTPGVVAPVARPNPPQTAAEPATPSVGSPVAAVPPPTTTTANPAFAVGSPAVGTTDPKEADPSAVVGATLAGAVQTLAQLSNIGNGAGSSVGSGGSSGGGSNPGSNSQAGSQGGGGQSNNPGAGGMSVGASFDGNQAGGPSGGAQVMSFSGQTPQQSIPPPPSGGQVGEIRHPYIVSLRKGGQGHYCTGVLVSSQFVATAAQCVDTGSSPFAYDKPTLYIGGLPREQPVEQRQTAGLTIHPNWNRDKYSGYDVAVIKMDSPVGLKPINFPKQDAGVGDDEWLKGLGWGRSSENGPFADALQQVSMPYVKPDACAEFTSMASNPAALCAGGKGSDLCIGDEGAPLFRDGGNPSNDLLLGIASFREAKCGSIGMPGMYTRVDKIGQWISENVY